MFIVDITIWACSLLVPCKLRLALAAIFPCALDTSTLYDPESAPLALSTVIISVYVLSFPATGSILNLSRSLASRGASSRNHCVVGFGAASISQLKTTALPSCRNDGFLVNLGAMLIVPAVHAQSPVDCISTAGADIDAYKRSEPHHRRPVSATTNIHTNNIGLSNGQWCWRYVPPWHSELATNWQMRNARYGHIFYCVWLWLRVGQDDTVNYMHILW